MSESTIKNLTVLGIESSYYTVSVAIHKQGKQLSCVSQEVQAQGMEVLLSRVEQALAMAQIEQAELDAICINQGPGSFTAMRISIASAQALAWALRIPLLAAPSFLIYAKTMFFQNRLHVVLPAYKGELFHTLYSKEKEEVKQETDIVVSSIESFLASLQPGDTVCGLAIDTVIKKQGYSFPDYVTVLAPVRHMIQASSVIFALENEKPPLYTEVKPIEPLYIRETDAAVSYRKRFS